MVGAGKICLASLLGLSVSRSDASYLFPGGMLRRMFAQVSESSGFDPRSQAYRHGAGAYTTQIDQSLVSY